MNMNIMMTMIEILTGKLKKIAYVFQNHAY